MNIKVYFYATILLTILSVYIFGVDVRTNLDTNASAENPAYTSRYRITTRTPDSQCRCG